MTTAQKGLTVTLRPDGFDDVQRKLEEALRRGADIDVFLKWGAAYYLKVWDENWRDQGTRYHSGGWQKLSDATIAKRSYTTATTGVTIMQESGELRRSGVTKLYRRSHVDIGTNKRYAPAHQWGITPFKAFGKWPGKTLPQRILIAVEKREDAPRLDKLAQRFIERTMAFGV